MVLHADADALIPSRGQALADLESGSFANLAAQLLPQSVQVVRENSGLMAGAGGGDISEAGT
ncbi:MAG: hypothetical protein JRN15_16935, partial [Nitrososphaerota archaeon]|nr:hypothetical protein [Nitrososphaerota archaeon]